MVDETLLSAPSMVAARRARGIGFVLAALFAGLVPMHLALLTGNARTVMVAVAAASALGALAFGVYADRRPERLTPRSVDVLALAPLLNSLTLLGVTGDIRQTTRLMIVLVAIGAGVTSRRTAALLCSMGVLIWGVLVADLPGEGRVAAVAYGFELAAAVLLAVVLFVVRSRRTSELLALHARQLEDAGRMQGAQQELETSERRFRSVFRDSPVGIGLSDEHGHFVAANAALCQLLGREEKELLGRTSVGFTHPDDVSSHSVAQALMAASPDGVARVEKRYLRPSGEVRWAWLTVNHVDGPLGQPWTLAHIQDVTDRKATEQALADSEANLSAVAGVVRRIRTGQDARQAITAAALELAGASSCCILELRSPDALVVTQSAGMRLEGTTIGLDEVSASVGVFRSGQPLFLSDVADDPMAAQALLEVTGARSALWQPVIADGVVTGVLAVTWSYRVASVQDRVVRAIELLADETAVALEHDQLLTRLADMAATDTLTGVANRRAWDDQLAELIGQSRRTGLPLTVALADLDNFKAFNDRHGHLRGDALLTATARRFQSQLREDDLLARWGGEEFAIALPGCDSAAAEPFLERLRPAVTHNQTCSIGYATWDGVESPEHLLARADAALYDAKLAGRDRSVAALLPRPRHERDEDRYDSDVPA